MKIVVNSGNLGTPVALELAKRGLDVAIAVRTPKSNPAWEKLGVSQVRFDIGDLESMTEALRGANAFFSVTPLVEDFVQAGKRAVQAAKLAGVGKIVRSSAQGSGPQAGIELGRWHFAVEKAIEESGIPFVVIRPANFMQNYLNFGFPETIRAQGLFYSPLAEAKISAIDTRDISAIATKVILEDGHAGKRYELTGGESLSIQEIAQLFSKALGREIAAVTVSEEAAEAAMAQGGVPPWLVRLLGELNGIGKAGYLSAILPDSEALLGRKPISFYQFILDHLDRFKA